MVKLAKSKVSKYMLRNSLTKVNHVFLKKDTPIPAPSIVPGEKVVIFMGASAAMHYKYRGNEVLISIRDTLDPPLDLGHLTNPPKEVLTLNFHDYIGSQSEKACGYREVNHSDTDQIAKFVKKHEEVTTLLVHCSYGQSRSRAVAFAIANTEKRTIYHRSNGITGMVGNVHDFGNHKLYDQTSYALFSYEEDAVPIQIKTKVEECLLPNPVSISK